MMNQDLNLDLIRFQSPKYESIFLDDSDHWLAFREKRFAVAGDGEYVTLRGLDLSGLDLHDFVVNHLAFVQCNLDNVLFRDTDFTFGTAFVNCSMKGVDFRGNTYGGGNLFYGTDLTNIRFSDTHSWTSVDLDHNKIPSFFVNCLIDPATKNWLTEDGNRVIEDVAKAKTADYAEVSRILYEVAVAPILAV